MSGRPVGGRERSLRSGHGLVMPAAFVVLTLAFALLPESNALIRFPLTCLVGGFVGIGAELSALGDGRGRRWRRESGTLWIIPFGVTVTMMLGLTSSVERGWYLAPGASLLVLAAWSVQWGELDGPRRLRPWAHAACVGGAYAIAVAAYLVSAQLPMIQAIIWSALVTAVAALVVLRGGRAGGWDGPRLAALSGFVGAEVVTVIHGITSPLAFALPLLATLYGLSGAARAMVEHSPARAYVEVVLVVVVVVVVSSMWFTRF